MSHDPSKDVDDEIEFASTDGFGGTIVGPLDDDPAPSAGARDIDLEKDANAFDNDDDLTNAGSSPEFEHLRKPHSHE